jgi:hypothetical protein
VTVSSATKPDQTTGDQYVGQLPATVGFSGLMGLEWQANLRASSGHPISSSITSRRLAGISGFGCREVDAISH